MVKLFGQRRTAGSFPTGFFTVAIVVTVGFSSLGCRPEILSTATVDGRVTVVDSSNASRPLSGAVITFQPIDKTTGPNASAPVFDGAFTVTTDAGLHGGTYRVHVAMIPPELRRGLPADVIDRMPPDDAIVDPKYDANSRQTCVLALGPNDDVEFEIEFLQ